MNVITIIHPNDFSYPLSKEIYNDKSIIYHGTSYNYDESIETKCWIISEIPYVQKEVTYVLDLYESINYFSLGYKDLASYARSERLPSFTKRYWAARNYSRNPAGETIIALYQATKSFLEFIADDQNFKRHAEKLKKSSYAGDPNLQKYLDNLKNVQSLRSQKEELLKIIQKYDSLVKNHFPVVYVVSSALEYFDSWFSPNGLYPENSIQQYFHRQNELRAKKSISPENIIARINFPNGVQNFGITSQISLPLPWAWDNFIDYYNKYIKEKCIIYSRDWYRELNDERSLDLTLEEIGRLLIDEQIIPNYNKCEEDDFNHKLPRNFVYRRDLTFYYRLKNINYKDKEIEIEQLEDVYKIDVTVAVQRLDYYYKLYVFAIDREYPIKIF